jgi:hypothetical protein
MAKSNYPNKLDTSIEIPAVRDNIIEIGSDVLNSLRSAIFQIERTLGINPQGAAGNSVAGRLEKALDGNGNILSEALDKAGLLSGPISNEDVSKAAAIAESKLRLNFPTKLLQDEISQLDLQLGLLESVIDELSALYATHVHPSATNRHKGKAIVVEEILSAPSDIGITTSKEVTAQEAFQQLYDSHINYSGTDITSANRSHTSSQLYFDNENVSASISGDDVQEVIEEIVDLVEGQVDNHQNLYHANSVLRSNVLSDVSTPTKGILLLGEEDVSYQKSNTDADSFISNVLLLDSPDAPSLSIEASDILEITISGETSSFQILRANLSIDGKTLESIDIYGSFSASSETGTTAKVYRNRNRESEPVGLLLAAREYQSSGLISYSNADVIQISNPNSANVITNGIRPAEISLTNRYLKISLDGASSVEVDLYDGALALTGDSQSIDSIAKAFNAQFAENRMSVTAYRVDFDAGRASEIALIHSIPSSTTEEHTIKISKGSDDAIGSIGLSGVEGLTVTSEIGTQYSIQGKDFTGLSTKLSAFGLVLLSGTASVSSSSIDFEAIGVRNGDILVISESAGDDGTYVILDVSTSSFAVDRTQLPSNQWSSVTSNDTLFTIYRNSVSLNEMAFKVLPGGDSSASIVDVLMDRDSRSIFYKERLSYGYQTYLGSENLVAIADFSGDITPYAKSTPGELSIQKISADPSDLEIGLSLDSGEVFKFTNIKSEYVTIHSGKYNLSLSIFIKDSDSIASKIIADASDFTISLYGYSGLNEEENLLLGRVLYEAGNSRITGAGGDYPRPFGKLRKGSIGTKDIGTDVLHKLYQEPLSETRSNGVIRGLEVTQVTDNGTTYTVSISSGVCYVRGKRFELDEISDYITDVETGGPPVSVDKFYVGINQWGEVTFRAPDPASCDCPFSPYDYSILASAENDGSDIDIIDFRLFIDNLDLRILNSITVSPQAGMGHFSDINKALKYAKRFSQAFPKAGIPTVHLKSGTHQVVTEMDLALADYTPREAADVQPAYDGGIWLNFPVNIVGEGESTVLDLVRTFANADIADDDRDRIDAESVMNNWMYIAGAGLDSSAPDGDSDTLISGVINIRDLKFNHSGILIFDPTIEDGGSKLNFSINIENVIFDRANRAIFDQYNYGILVQGLDTSSGVKAGNISISNCEFLNTHIKTNSYDSADHCNISITNNNFRGSGDGVVDGEDHYAIFVSGSGHIFDFEDSPSENNIEFRGNTASDSTGNSSSPTPDAAGTHLWGDRISRNLSAGKKIGIGAAVEPHHPNLLIHRGGPSDTTSILHAGDTPATASIVSFDSSVIEDAFLSVGANANSNTVIGRFRALDDGSNSKVTIGTITNHKLELNTNNNLAIVIDESQRVGVGTDTPFGLLTVQSAAAAYDASDASGYAISDYHTIISQYGNDTGSEIGIGFRISASQDVTDRVGASITHERVGGHSQGKLHFKTKASTTDSGYAQTRMTIGEDGNVGLENSSPRAKLTVIQNVPSPSLATGGESGRGIELAAHSGNQTEACAIYYTAAADPIGAPTGLYFDFTTNGVNYPTKAYVSSTATPGELDFTGQHRSDSDPALKNVENIGLIVSSLGEYINLDLSVKAEINEALPTVGLASKRKDKKAYGVISNIEDSGERREYASGSFVSVLSKKDDRLIINALGEGGIWVCNINGDFENGDYITTCEIPGYGMLQDDDLLHNYTVAKITCDCTFDLDSETYDCLEFEHDGQTYRKAFVGCTYHCG